MDVSTLAFKPAKFWDGDLPWPDVLSTRRKELSGLKPSGTPEEAVRQICSNRLPFGEELPPTKRFEVFHVRGIDGPSVPYTPVFAYLLDVGWKTFPLVYVAYEVNGSGAPNFPDFNRAAVMTAATDSAKDIIFPAVTGDVIFGVEAGTTLDVIQATLGHLVANIQLLATDTYTGNVLAFREAEVCNEMKSTASFVRYAELNLLVRDVTLDPGWRADRVA